LLSDDLKKPSFEWGETFCTLVSNRLRIYTNNEFLMQDTSIMYYRKPQMIQIDGCVDPYTTQLSTKEVPCEFKDDIAETLIDEAVQILAGDIEAMNEYQIASQSTQENT